MKYRIRPHDVDAFRLTSMTQEIPDWAAGRVTVDTTGGILNVGEFVIIQTAAGKLRARLGDYIVGDEDGELMAYSPEQFAQLYRELEDAPGKAPEQQGAATRPRRKQR